MELTEEIKTINQSLRDNFGVDTITGQPMWRVVWAEDQLEKVLADFTDYTTNGIFIRQVREVREVPKYYWIKGLYVLERLVLVPEVNQDELLGVKLSYECIWPFADKNGGYLPPLYEACEYIIHSVLVAQHGPKAGLKKFAELDDMGSNHHEELIKKDKRIGQIMLELFGDESGLLGDTVDASGSTIFVPSEYAKVDLTTYKMPKES
jgi:hypothetical protein